MATTKGGLISKATAEKAVAPAQKNLQSMIVSMKNQIGKALTGTGVTPERFTRMALTAVSTNPQLGKCTPNSFLGAMMQSAALGLEPNSPLGYSYLIPYRNKGMLECQFQVGYRGLLQLAYRGGEITDISAHEVYEGDDFEYELGLEPKLKHTPALENRGNVKLYYAVYHTKSGGYGFEVMSVEDVKRHMNKFSKAAGSGFSPWNNNFDEMAKKTLIKKLLKYAPLSTEVVRTLAADETIKSVDENNLADNVLDLQDETEINITPEVNKQTGEIEEEIPFGDEQK